MITLSEDERVSTITYLFLNVNSCSLGKDALNVKDLRRFYLLLPSHHIRKIFFLILITIVRLVLAF